MKEWFSSSELVGAALLPTTMCGLRKTASRECWQKRKRTKGKGFEYHIDSLPKETQRALRISLAKTSVNSHYEQGVDTAKCLIKQDKSADEQRRNRLGQGIKDYMKLTGKGRTRSDAKQDILIAIEDFQKASQLGRSKAVESFCSAYNGGEIKLELWIHQTHPELKRSTVYRWFKLRDENGIASLAGDYGKGRKGTGVIDSQPELKEYVIGMVVQKPHIKGKTLLKAIKAQFNGESITYPAQRTLERWVSNWKGSNKQVYSAITNPDEWKNKYMVAFGSANEDVTALNQLWEFDSTPADMMLTDGRHSLIGVIDVYSRRIKFVVSPTSNSKGVAQVIRAAILDWGVPEYAKTDNGSDYKSRHIKSVFKRLDIEQEFCTPFHGWEKPHIERVFKTFAHGIAELLPGFIGHNVAERSAIEARKSFSDRLFKKDQIIDVEMSSIELQQFCNRWIESEYHNDIHGSLGKSPVEMVREWPYPIKCIDDERILDVLLSEPSHSRIINKKGISLNGGTYIHPLLAAHMGDEIQPYYDDRDIGKIYVYDMDGNYICTAEDPNISGVSRAEVAAEAKSIQREAAEERRRELKAAAKKVTNNDVAMQILAHREQQIDRSNIAEFPKVTESHSSDAIETTQRMFYQQRVGEVELEDAKKRLAESKNEGGKTAEIISFGSDSEKYKIWKELNRHVESGGEIDSDRDATFYDTFPRTEIYSVQKRMEAMQKEFDQKYGA